MPDTPDPKDVQKALLSNLIFMLSSSAMQHMGKLVDPEVGKAQVNLPAAQVMVDMLEMLQEKMKGNLDTEEEALFAQTLSTLQMTYVDAAKEQPSESTSEAPAAADQAPAEEPGTPEPEIKATGPGNDKEAKFHKSYG